MSAFLSVLVVRSHRIGPNTRPQTFPDMYMQQLEQGGSVETLESYAELDSALTPLNVMYAGMP